MFHLGPLLLQIRHIHHLHHQTRPPGEMLRSLALPALGVILLPREAGPLPLAKHVLHQIRAELAIHPGCLRAMRIPASTAVTGGDIVQRLDDQIIHVHPDGGAPVVLAGGVVGIAPAQAADAVVAPQFVRVGDEVEHGLQARAVGGEEPRQEGEDGDVALVADVRALLVVVDGGVAVGLVRGAPVQVVDVAHDGPFLTRVLGCVVVFADEGGDPFDRACHHAHPADQVGVQLAWVGGLRAGVVVEPGREDVAFGAAAPAVGFFGGVGDAVVGFDVAALGFAEPGVVAFEKRVKGFEVG